MPEPPADDDRPCLVLSNCPDEALAQTIGQRLVGDRMAAAVNVIAGVRSTFRWRGQLVTRTEALLVVRTTRARYEEVEAAIRAEHPYELPGIVQVPVLGGSGPYLAWIAGETAPDGCPPSRDPG